MNTKGFTKKQLNQIEELLKKNSENNKQIVPMIIPQIVQPRHCACCHCRPVLPPYPIQPIYPYQPYTYSMNLNLPGTVLC